MSYSKTNWQNLPNTTTPVNQTNLNKIETELKYLDDKSLIHKGNLANNTDLNNVTETGIYYTADVTLINAPADYYYGWQVLQVIQSYGALSVYQILISSTATHIRQLAGTPLKWGKWRKYTATSADTSTLTVNSSYFSTIDVNRVRREGNTVIIDFRGLVKTDIPRDTAGVLTTPYASSIGSAETGVAYIGNQYGQGTLTPKWFYIGSGNSIRLELISANNWVHIHHVYMTND